MPKGMEPVAGLQNWVPWSICRGIQKRFQILVRLPAYGYDLGIRSGGASGNRHAIAQSGYDGCQKHG